MNTTPSIAVPHGESRSQQRIEWIDYAKGICIFMVVMLHTTHWVEADRNWAPGWLDPVVQFAKPFRMPDFFLLSGLLLGRVINRPWKQYLDTKVVHFFYFYILWEIILFLSFNVRESWKHGWEGSDRLLTDFLMDMVNPNFPLWFIHSLPIYFVVTRLIKRVSPWLVLGVLAILHSLTSLHQLEVAERSFVINQFCLRYMYFYSGYLFAARVLSLASSVSTNRGLALLYVGIWIVINQWAVNPPEFAELPLISIALGYMGAIGVIVIACLLAQYAHAHWLQYLGKNSLIVYLGFLIPVLIYNRLTSFFISDVGLADIVVTLASILTTILVFRLLRDTPLKFLYVRPAWAYIWRTQGKSGAAAHGGKTNDPANVASQ